MKLFATISPETNENKDILRHWYKIELYKRQRRLHRVNNTQNVVIFFGWHYGNFFLLQQNAQYLTVLQMKTRLLQTTDPIRFLTDPVKPGYSTSTFFTH